MTDKIEITPDDLDAWMNCADNTAPHKTKRQLFDSLVAFVEKQRQPKRHRWDNVTRVYGGHDSYKTFLPMSIVQTFSDDIGPMTKQEAREWISSTWYKYRATDLRTDSVEFFLRALGLGDK